MPRQEDARERERERERERNERERENKMAKGKKKREIWKIFFKKVIILNFIQMNILPSCLV